MPHVHVSFSYTFFLSFAYGHYDNPYAYISAVLEGQYVCCMDFNIASAEIYFYLDQAYQ